MDWQDLATLEFTMSGALAPADPIRWPVDAYPEQMFALNGWRFTWWELLVLGAPAWILCRSRGAILMLVRDFLRPLAELNRPGAASEILEHAAGRLGDTLIDRLEGFLLEEAVREPEPREASSRAARSRASEKRETAAEASNS